MRWANPIIMSQKILNTGNEILTIQPPPANVDSNWFNLSHDNKFSCNPGDLVPCLLLETMPGDYFKIGPELLQRLAPLATPAFQRMNTRMEFFFVPMRILWPESNAFFGPPNANSLPPAFPSWYNQPNYTKTLGDYLGLPSWDPSVGPTMNLDRFNALPHYAYHAIYDTWYKDENLNVMPSTNVPFITAVSGDNQLFNPYVPFNQLKQRNNDRDYFTSVTPTAQKGPVVVIPFVGGTGNIAVHLQNTATPQILRDSAMAALPNTNLESVGSGNLGRPGVGLDWLDPNGTLGIDANDINILAGTIPELRAASALQRFLEADLMGGTKFDELIWQHFRVSTSNRSIQFPEYLGSTHQAVHISEVLQTSESASTPQGNMAGHGVSANKHGDIHYHCEEWGYIMGIMSTIPTTGYSQGIPKKFSKFDRMEFGFPEFANIGMQSVKNREIYYSNNQPVDDADFGYLPMYSEYRIETNKLAGEFRTNLTNWTLSNLYSGLPVLGQSFLQVDPTETMRIFAVTSVTDDHLYNHAYFDITVNRKLPKYMSPILK